MSYNLAAAPRLQNLTAAATKFYQLQFLMFIHELGPPRSTSKNLCNLPYEKLLTKFKFYDIIYIENEI